MNIAAATRKFINSKNPASSSFLSLDKIIENNTSIKIQHKTVAEYGNRIKVSEHRIEDLEKENHHG